MTNPEKPTPADRVVDILKRELPGMEAMFQPGDDTFRVRGSFRFGASAVIDPIYAVPTEHHHEAAERLAAELIFITRREAIAGLGIEAMIAEREKRARRQGVREGDAAGYNRGVAEGRRAMLAEILAAKPDEDDA